WRPVRSKDGLGVFKQRAATALCKERAASSESNASSRAVDHSSSSASSSEPATPSANANAASASYVEWLKRPQVPLLTLSGVLDGTLDDAMFGCFADTDESWRWRSTYANERFDDARILTKVLGPTPAEPYRYLGIKWFIKEHPPALGQFFKRRDFLILEATGVTEDSQGRRVGYLLMHSVAIPRVPELRELGVVRATLSFCFLIRPHADARVEIYCRGFTDPQGDMLEAVSVRLAAESLISAAAVVDYANVKKLKWLLLARQQQQQQEQRDGEPPRQSSTRRCESCQRSLSKFALLPAAASSSVGAACNLCWKVICGRCSVAKKIAMHIVDNQPIYKVLHFCVGCILEAKNASALALARAAIPSLPSAAPTPTRSSSRRRPLSQSQVQLRKDWSTSSHVSERHLQPAAPPARRPPPPQPPVAHSHKATVSHSTTSVR
ncbi:hypothetical protein PybrP1_005206, partial [[Pythium] brassicae (nom. inval.)]